MECKLLTTLLLAIGAAILATDAPSAATARPLVGVIRWDGYTGSSHVTQQQEMGFLKPEKWQRRAPWFFRKTGDPEHPLVFNPNYDKRTIREITDQEIEYAASAGIDYWAFCYYPKYKGGWQLRDSFDAYLTSPLKNKIKASLILIAEHVGKGLSPAAIAAPDADRKDWERMVNDIVPLLRDGSYQKVCDGDRSSIFCSLIHCRRLSAIPRAKARSLRICARLSPIFKSNRRGQARAILRSSA